MGDKLVEDDRERLEAVEISLYFVISLPPGGVVVDAWEMFILGGSRIMLKYMKKVRMNIPMR